MYSQKSARTLTSEVTNLASSAHGSRGCYELLAFSRHGPLSRSAHYLARCPHQSDKYFPGAIDATARPKYLAELEIQVVIDRLDDGPQAAKRIDSCTV